MHVGHLGMEVMCKHESMNKVSQGKIEPFTGMPWPQGKAFTVQHS
jgi:hypothetical protein